MITLEAPRDHAMHPIHLDYVKRHPFNDFAELFAVIDQLDPRKRDAAMMDTFCQFVSMRKQTPDLHTAREPWDALFDDYANYKRFKEECQRLPANLNESFLVLGIVSYTLSLRFGWAELDKEAIVAISQKYIGEMTEHLKNTPTEEVRQWQRQMIESTHNRIANIDNEIAEARELYTYVCENLTRPLLQVWRRRLNVPDPAE